MILIIFLPEIAVHYVCKQKNGSSYINIGFTKFTHILVEEAVEGCGEEPLQAGQQTGAEGPEGKVDDTGLGERGTVRTRMKVVFFINLKFYMSLFCNL